MLSLVTQTWQYRIPKQQQTGKYLMIFQFFLKVLHSILNTSSKNWPALKLWALQEDKNIWSGSRKSHDMAWAWLPSETLLPSCQVKICFTFSQNIYFSTKTFFDFYKVLLRELSKKLHKLITLFMYLLEKEVFKNKQKPTKQTKHYWATCAFCFLLYLYSYWFTFTVNCLGLHFKEKRGKFWI